LQVGTVCDTIKEVCMTKLSKIYGHNYFHPDLPEVLTIPYARPIKAIYVKQAIAAVGKVEVERGDDE
jgi:hypothetical protein